MARVTHILFSLLVLPFLVAAASGCGSIDDDLSDCPPIVSPPEDEEIIIERMVVRAYDAATGEDITISERVVDGALFLFDSNKKLTQFVNVTKAELGVEKPVPIAPATRAAGDKIYVAAWGNIVNSLQVVGTFDWGWDITTPFLELLPDVVNTTGENLYWLFPKEMFTGLKEITLGVDDDPSTNGPDAVRPNVRGENTPIRKIVHEIPIEQVNSLLHITVKGLPADFPADDYYFLLEKQNYGYDFRGEPIGVDQREMIGLGNFQTNGDLVTDVPYNLIPSLNPENITTTNAMTLHLYQKGAGGGTRAAGDIDLAGEVTKDIEGDLIGLFRGMQTNVLIQWSDGGPGVGDLTVQVTVTPWGQIEQWETWGR